MSQGRKDHLRFLSSEFFLEIKQWHRKMLVGLRTVKRNVTGQPGPFQVSLSSALQWKSQKCILAIWWSYVNKSGSNLNNFTQKECWWSRCQLWTNYMELILLCHQLWTREWTLDFLISDLKQCLFSDHGGWLTKSRCHWRTLGWQQIYAWWTQGQVI